MIDTELPPPLSTDLDTVRVRATDPITSHQAADKSQRTISRVRLGVLQTLKLSGPLVGSQINDWYAHASSRGEVAAAAWDSPRKRAGELFDLGYLDVEGTRNGERVFKINARGIAELNKEN